MTNKEIKDFTSKLVSLKNDNSINKINLQEKKRIIGELTLQLAEAQSVISDLRFTLYNLKDKINK